MENIIYRTTILDRPKMAEIYKGDTKNPAIPPIVAYATDEANSYAVWLSIPIDIDDRAALLSVANIPKTLTSKSSVTEAAFCLQMCPNRQLFQFIISAIKAEISALTTLEPPIDNKRTFIGRTQDLVEALQFMTSLNSAWTEPLQGQKPVGD